MNFLFSCFYANGWHGSIIHILEIAEYLISQGHTVDIGSFNLTNDVKQYAIQNKINLMHISEIDNNKIYDIYWALHFPTVVYLANKNIKYKKIIFNSLSPFNGLEIQPCNNDDMLIVCNSFETMQERKKDGANHCYLLKNLAPDNYFSKINNNLQLNKIAVVSNHIDTELIKLKHKLNIDFYGIDYKYEKITLDILKKYDLIITIGKTVQYCFLSGVPVFVYDIYGGSGYINNETLKINEKYNFSGRSITSINKENILNIIIDGYKNNLNNLEFLQKYALENCLLSKNINQLLDYIQNYEYKFIIKENINYKKEKLIYELL